MSKWNDSIEKARAEADRLGLPCRRLVSADIRYNINPQPSGEPEPDVAVQTVVTGDLRVEIHRSPSGRDSEFRFVPDGLPFK
jgi:hypothetical protein